MFHKMFVLMLGVIMATLVVGCNTVKGVGQDVQSGGKAISKSAEKVSEKM
ncbi:entericidin A/B family lipoprotein [Gilliamella sp. wkB112]|nr:entericidin A/B family lipoprotein [Gilliamella apicola]